MRRYVFLAAALLFACGGEENTPPKAPSSAPPPVAAPPVAAPTRVEAPPPPPSPEEARKATMQAFVDAMNARDAKKVASCYSDGATLRMVGTPPVTGRDAILAAYQQTFTAFPDFATNASRILPSGEQVAVQWAYNGTHKGNLFGIPATDKKTGANGADVMTFDADGKIKEHRVYWDPSTPIGQLGINPKLRARAVPALPDKPEVVDGPALDGAKNIETMKAFVAAMDSKKEADVLALLSDDFVWDDYGAPAPLKGKADAKKYVKEIAATFPDARHSIQVVFAVGPYVVTEDTIEATHKQLKKPIKAHGLQVVEVRDGKIVRGWSYSNNLDLAMQLGLLAAPK